MEIFSKVLHEQGKNVYVKDFKEQSSDTWPAEWKITFYKDYSRFPQIPLPDTKPQVDLFDAIQSRKSDREFSGNALSIEQLGTLLKYSCGEFKQTTNESRGGYRAYPSAGARFPIEPYLLLFKGSDDVPSGVYHYSMKRHALESMWDGGESFADTSLLMKSEWTKNASALIVFTGIFWRSQNKYRARGYRMACIEAGTIIQNLYLVSRAVGLKCVAFSGTNDDNIEALLDLDTDLEPLVLSVLIGT